MQTEARFQITYTLTAWDYAAMARALTRRPWKRSIVTVALWLFSVWCLLVFFTDLYNPVTMANAVAESSSWFWILACLIVVILFSLATHWLSWAASFLYYRQIASADATISITLSDDAIRVRSSVADSTVPWATVKCVIREQDYMMLPISKREAFILPRRSFENQESFEQALRYASERLSAGPIGAG